MYKFVFFFLKLGFLMLYFFNNYNYIGQVAIKIVKTNYSKRYAAFGFILCLLYNIMYYVYCFDTLYKLLFLNVNVQISKEQKISLNDNFE